MPVNFAVLLMLISSLLVSSPSKADIPSPGEIISAVKTAVSIGKDIAGLIADIHRDIRNGDFLRTNEPTVTLIKVHSSAAKEAMAALMKANPVFANMAFATLLSDITSGQYGLGNMKSIDSYSADYFLGAQSAADRTRLTSIKQSPIAGSVETLLELADKNRFKRNGPRAQLGFQQNFSQSHLVVLGKGSLLHFSGVPGVGKFSVDFSPLEMMLKDLAYAIDHDIEESQYQLIVNKYKKYLTQFWFNVDSEDADVTVSVHWPTLLPKYVKKK